MQLYAVERRQIKVRGSGIRRFQALQAGKDGWPMDPSRVAADLERARRAHLLLAHGRFWRPVRLRRYSGAQ